MMNRAIFLDRDGVLNHAPVKNGVPQSPRTISEIEILPHVLESIQYFKARGFTNVVITNQPDVSRGKAPKNLLESVHNHILAECDLVHSYICWHDDEDRCQCRKPEPGLIFEAAKDLDIDLGNSILVGDRWKDINAGNKAGVKTFFIDRKYQEKSPEPPFETIESLYELCQRI
jgi:D-glycero-D-manno-heptose 1,7-bisphosphate phosphatase